MTIAGGNFGAAIFHEGEEAWGIYHPVGDTGKVARPSTPDLQIFSLDINIEKTDKLYEQHIRVS
jgi:hypothetical protein